MDGGLRKGDAEVGGGQMYRCRLTYDEWKCMLSKNRIGKRFETKEFTGYLGLLEIGEVSEPQVWRYREQPLTVCDKHYRWLTILPREDFYCITVMMNEKEQIQVCYIDMIEEQGYDEDGVPWFNDLYLDLVVYPDGVVVEDDRDELEDALAEGDISKEQYDLAVDTCEKLKEGLLKEKDEFQAYIRELFELFKREAI